MNCPICTKPIPPRHEITCPECWFKIPGNERHALARMHREKNTSGLNAKLAKLKRLIEAKEAKKAPVLIGFDIASGPDVSVQPYKAQ